MQPAMRALPWLLALLCALVFLPALAASFQFDDWQVVLADPRVASLEAWWHSMPGMRALVKLSYALNHQWGGQVEGFRALNIALHALNVALVFALVRRLALRLRTADERGALTVAACVALVFGLHPVQTESVTYIAARPNLVAALFSLLGLLAWLRGRDRRPSLWWPLAALCYVAALAGKETAAVLPLAMLLCLAAEPGAHTRRDYALPLLLCVLAGLLLLLVWPLFPYDYLLQTSLATRAPLQNLVAQVHGIGWLAGQLVRWDLLNADPSLQPVSTLTVSSAIGALMLLTLLALGLLALRRLPALGFGILWFLLWLAPTNSLLARLDLANDRQLYLALIGPAWCLAHVVPRIPARWRMALVALLAVTLATGTVLRNRVYATEVRFWQDVADKSPHNLRAWNNLGIAHAMACEHDAAVRAFGEAIRRAPREPLAQVNLALLEQGELPGMPASCNARTVR